MSARMRWAADLVLGVRLAVGGGRTSWARLALTAAGVGLGVTVLLLAASIGPAREAKSARVAATAPSYVQDESAPLRVRQVFVDWQGRKISGVEVAAVGQGAAPPPGVGRLPLPGEVVVSPELLELMAADDSARARFPERVIGVIGEVGLPRPKSLLFYAGLADTAAAAPALGFGGEYYRQQWPLVYGLLVVAAIVALLVPLAIFVMVATRLGATGREQRLAAIRLAGGSRAQVHRIASGETLAGALLGLLVGVALYFAARPLARFIEVEGVGFFPTDLLPDPLLGVLIAVGVPVVAVGSALLGLRAVDIGPLGLSRRTEVPARRGWWRFALVGAGALVLVSISLTSDFWSVMTDPVVTLALGAGIGLVLVGTGAVLPWLVGRVSRGQVEGIAPMLALRGLRHDRNTPRVLAGVVVVLTGSLTLQVLLSAAADFTADSFGAGTADEGTGRWTLALSEPTPLRELEEAIALVGGVRRISEVRWGATTGGKPHGVVSTDCAELAHMLGVRDCAPGRAYWVHDGRDAPRPGTRTVLAGRDWTIPDYQVLIDTPSDSRLPAGLLVAGGADPVLSALRPYQLVVEGDPDAAFADRLLAATGRVDRAVRLSTGQSAQVELFTSLRSGVIGASVLLTLLAVVGLAAAAVDQVWERRRPVAVLAANGVPRRTLAAAAAWQAAVPTALGLALATPLGLGTAWLLVPSERFRVDWSEVVVTVGTAAVVVLAVSLCTLPALRSAIRPSALRTE